MTKGLLVASDALSRVVVGVGKVGAWASFALMLVITYDVVSRKYFATGSTRLQELEWHLHAVLFLSCLGYAYLANAHVRIDLVRERLPSRAQRWVEFLGCVLFLLPFFGLCTYFGIEFVRLAYTQGEGSPNVGGLPHWWVIKSVMVAGFVLILLAGLSVLLRTSVALFGSGAAREAAIAAEGPRS